MDSSYSFSAQGSDCRYAWVRGEGGAPGSCSAVELMLFSRSMPMLRATSSRRLGKSLRALGAATSAGAAAGAIFQWTSPAVARADWDPRVAVGTMAGVVGAAAGGAGGLAAMAVAGALITLNPNLTGSGPRAVVVAGPSGVGKGMPHLLPCHSIPHTYL